MGAEGGPPPYRCPACTGPLERRAPPAFDCPGCGRSYPLHSGIPDFRLWPDPYIAAEDDWAKGARVAHQAGAGGFRAMLQAYWRLTPDVPPAQAARFIRYALVAEARGRARLDRVRQVRGRDLDRSDAVLDLGCGTGGLLVAAGRRAGAVVGVDIAARWLVQARQRLAEADLANVLLACACAEHLPFGDGSFDVVVASDVLEHCQDQARLLREARRVLRPAGVLLLVTQNRWSACGEPHVGVWGVGFLPRRWMAPYVRLVRGLPYRLIRLVSPLELERLLRRAGLRVLRRPIPQPAPEELAGLDARTRRLVAIYERLTRLPLLRPLLLVFGPALEVVAVRLPRDAAPGTGRQPADGGR